MLIKKNYKTIYLVLFTIMTVSCSKEDDSNNIPEDNNVVTSEELLTFSEYSNLEDVEIEEANDSEANDIIEEKRIVSRTNACFTIDRGRNRAHRGYVINLSYSASNIKGFKFEYYYPGNRRTSIWETDRNRIYGKIFNVRRDWTSHLRAYAFKFRYRIKWKDCVGVGSFKVCSTRWVRWSDWKTIRTDCNSRRSSHPIRA